MKYTDFNIRVHGKEIVFRHTASSVREFLSLEDEIIYDIYGVQAIKRREIISVELNPAPYVRMYMGIYKQPPNSLNDLWAWVYVFEPEELEQLLQKYKRG